MADRSLLSRSKLWVVGLVCLLLAMLLFFVFSDQAIDQTQGQWRDNDSYRTPAGTLGQSEGEAHSVPLANGGKHSIEILFRDPYGLIDVDQLRIQSIDSANSADNVTDRISKGRHRISLVGGLYQLYSQREDCPPVVKKFRVGEAQAESQIHGVLQVVDGKLEIEHLPESEILVSIFHGQLIKPAVGWIELKDPIRLL